MPVDFQAICASFVETNVDQIVDVIQDNFGDSNNTCYIHSQCLSLVIIKDKVSQDVSFWPFYNHFPRNRADDGRDPKLREIIRY